MNSNTKLGSEVKNFCLYNFVKLKLNFLKLFNAVLFIIHTHCFDLKVQWWMPKMDENIFSGAISTRFARILFCVQLSDFHLLLLSISFAEILK